MKMKAVSILLILRVTAYFIYIDGKLMTEFIINKQEIPNRIKITGEENDKLHKNQKHLKGKQSVKPTALKLSPQMAAAKKVCYSLHNLEHRIVNGTKPKRSSLPWMAAIFKEIDDLYKDTQYICGGSLISSWFVLSAAQCFLNIRKQWIVPSYAMLSVRLGLHDLSSRNFLLSGVAKVYIHPDYTSAKILVTSDIALVKLSKTVTYNDFIQPICVDHLTTPPSFNKFKNIKSVLISGWGRTGPGTGNSLFLLKGIASIEPHQACSKYANLYNQTTTICIGKQANESSVCAGDFGSPVIPLVFISKNDSMVFPVVIGIVSLLEPTCLGPAVLIKVESFIGWINYYTS